MIMEKTKPCHRITRFDALQKRERIGFAFLTVHPEKGFMVHEQCEVDMAFAMMSSASRSIMAVDASKFQPQARKPALRQPDLKKGDTLVTDVEPPEKFQQVLSHLEICVA